MKSQWNLLTGQRLAKIRLYSGLILFGYVCIHLANHTLGLISIDAMQAVNNLVSMVVRSVPLTIVLYGALALHFASAFARLLSRRTFRIPNSEKIQALLGLATPLLLVVHVMGTRYANAQYGINDSYYYVLLSTFVFSPISGWLNAAGLAAAWFHGCLGMHGWLRLKTWYSSQLQHWLTAFATLLPTLALTSYLFNGRATIPLSANGEFMEEYYRTLGPTDNETFAMLGADIDLVRWIIVATILTGVAARLLWGLNNTRVSRLKVLYQNGPSTSQRAGPTLLEMSKIARVPHASVCGGRGRCSTCRVQIIRGAETLDPPSESEQRVLSRFNATRDVRLACQIRPRKDLSVLRLLPADVTMVSASAHSPWASGQEKVITVIFADLRDFTGTTEHRLPFDVVYLINQFSRAMGNVVEGHGGRIDKFLGDGFMALFGLESTAQQGAIEAIRAAAGMQSQLAELNERLQDELDRPLRMGIGIHSGSVVLGEMGHGAARGLTAIGDTVNTASRLEASTKEFGCSVCVSEATLRLASLELPDASLKNMSVRGKTDKVTVAAIGNASELLPESELETA